MSSSFSSTSSNFSVGIVGGRGIMGKFFESVFLRYGIKTFVWSRKSEETLEEFCTTKNNKYGIYFKWL